MGVMDEKWEGFYDNGNQKFIANYSLGIKHGTYTKFYTNGRSGIKSTYNNGLLDGSYEVYHDQGLFIREKGQYKLVKTEQDTVRFKRDALREFRQELKKSVKNGLWTVYFDGTDIPFQKINYSNGRLSGLFTTFYSNGNVQSKINYQNGRKEGYSKFYDKNGKLVKKVKYKLDNKVK